MKEKYQQKVEQCHSKGSAMYFKQIMFSQIRLYPGKNLEIQENLRLTSYLFRYIHGIGHTDARDTKID